VRTRSEGGQRSNLEKQRKTSHERKAKKRPFAR
jgi:hypothetical protein